ncbi:MAG: hypothetical protein GEU99_06880 [Luteitalea sp.]|nr:hypothetical protein [Luteitalea sp.]
MGPDALSHVQSVVAGSAAKAQGVLGAPQPGTAAVPRAGGRPEGAVTPRRLVCAAVVAAVAWFGTPVQTAAQTTANVPAPAGSPEAADARVEELLAAVRAQQAVPNQPPTNEAAVLDLRLDEAVSLALERNPDVAAERLNPRLEELSLASLRGNYRPVLQTTISQNNTVQLPRNQLTGGDRVQDDTQTYEFGADQALPLGGGALQVSWLNRRQESSSNFNTFNPQYNSSLDLLLTQPLLRNFRTDDTRTQISLAQINRSVANLQLRATLTNTAADVRNAYWDLVYAIQAVDVTRQSLSLANKLVEDNKARVEVGAMAPLDVVQAEAEAAARRQTLAQAEATHRIAELSLKRLIVTGTNDPRWHARLNPVDQPGVSNEKADVAEALKNALASRTDLAEGERGLEATDLNMRLYRNQSLPTADLIASYGLQGIGGTEILRDGGLGGDVTETIPGDFGDALQRMAGRDFPTWNIQLQFSYPIGHSPAAASYQRARIQREQAAMSMKALELQVATEVTNAGLQVDSTLEQVDAARAARELAEQRLEAEQTRFDVGLSTAFFVVQAQRDLADAANVELRAVLDHRKALVDFERVQLTPSSGGPSLAVSGANSLGGVGGGGVNGVGATTSGAGNGVTGGNGTGSGPPGGGGTVP